MRASGQLPENIKEPESDERPAGDPGKERADAVAQGDPEPGDAEAEHGRERSMARGGERGDEQSLRAIPALHPRGEDEWQPMGRDGGVEKRNRKASDRNRGENGVVHRSR